MSMLELPGSPAVRTQAWVPSLVCGLRSHLAKKKKNPANFISHLSAVINSKREKGGQETQFICPRENKEGREKNK